MPRSFSQACAALIFVLTTACVVNAQSTPAPDCPTIEITGPVGIVAPGDIATYSVAVRFKTQPIEPTYQWSISSGEIISGQGSAVVEVRRPNGSITVTVELFGLPKDCPSSTSETASGPDRPLAVKIGEMRNSSTSNGVLLRQFVEELNNNPNNQGYILVGHPPGTTRPQMSARERSIRDAVRNIDPVNYDEPRIKIISVEKSAYVAEFWRVPPAADNPICRSCEPARSELPAIGDLVMADEFGKLSTSDELGRLDLIAADWQRNPSFYIFLYLSSDPKESRASKRTRLMRIKIHLTTRRKIPSDRVVMLKGDMSHHSTQIYLVPADARHNMPTGRDLTLMKIRTILISIQPTS